MGTPSVVHHSDGNITNLIVCGALYLTATAEVKGFAVTLTVGILATLFALFITRQYGSTPMSWDRSGCSCCPSRFL